MQTHKIRALHIDSVHAWTQNAVSYNPTTDQIMLSYNFVSTMLIIDHSTTTTEAKGESGGKWGRGCVAATAAVLLCRCRQWHNCLT